MSCRSVLALHYQTHLLVHLELLVQLEAEMALRLRQGVGRSRCHLGRAKSQGLLKLQAAG